MASIFGIVFPLYAAIAIGYGAVGAGWFTPANMQVLGRYVMQIALPALIFRAMASRELSEVIHPGYMLAYLAAGLATIAAAYLWFSFTAPDIRRRAVAVMGSACPNSGYIGYPLLLLVLPDIAGVILAQNMIVENVVLIPLCLVLMDLAEDRRQVPVARLVLNVAGDLVKRPMIIGLAAGVVFSAMGWQLPGAADRLFGMLAASASALALVVIGGSLVGLPLHGNRAMAAQIAAGKLLVHPFMAALAVLLLAGAGLAELAPDMRAALVLSAAMPMMGIYPVIAQERGLEGAASLAMLAATSGAFVTLSLLLYWLG